MRLREMLKGQTTQRQTGATQEPNLPAKVTEKLGRSHPSFGYLESVGELERDGGVRGRVDWLRCLGVNPPRAKPWGPACRCRLNSDALRVNNAFASNRH